MDPKCRTFERYLLDLAVCKQGSAFRVTCGGSQARQTFEDFHGVCVSRLPRTFYSAKGSDSPRIKVRFRGPGRTESKCFLQQGIPYNGFGASANAAHFNSQRSRPLRPNMVHRRAEPKPLPKKDMFSIQFCDLCMPSPAESV